MIRKAKETIFMYIHAFKHFKTTQRANGKAGARWGFLD